MERTDPIEGNSSIHESALYKELKIKAIELLARREYSRKELERKLLVRSDQASLPVLIESLLEWLEDVGYQSDLRFASSFIRSKANSGYGPNRINNDLYQKGIDKSLFNKVVEEEMIDFYELAFERMARKFSVELIVDYKSFQKCFRYMAGRGYTSDQIKYAKERMASDDANIE